MGVPVPNLPPSILWPPPPALPRGAHVWVIGGTLGGDAICDLVAADHVIAVTRHEIGVQQDPVSGPPDAPHQVVERLSPAAPLAADRQYQLRVRVAGRTEIVAVWTVVEPFERPEVDGMSLHDHHPQAVPGLPSHAPAGEIAPRFVALAMTGTAIVQVRADDGATAIDVIHGPGVIVAPRLAESTRAFQVRVLAPDGAVIAERALT